MRTIGTLFVGGRASVSYTLREPAVPSSPADVDAWLRAREGAVAGVIPGDEKRVLWARAPGIRTPLAILFIHGYQGSPLDYSPVLEHVAAALGANVFLTRLSGYNVTTETVKKVTVDDWVNDAWEALAVGHAIGERVIVVGSSMGGDLALWLGVQNRPETAALILLSCAVQPKDTRADMLLWPWPLPQIILAAVVGPYNSTALDPSHYPEENVSLYERYHPPRYPSVSTMKLMHVVKLVRTLPLEKVAAPSLWLYSDSDEAIDLTAMKRSFARIGGPKRLRRVDAAHGHVMAGDMYQPSANDVVAAEILSFLGDSGIVDGTAAVRQG